MSIRLRLDASGTGCRGSAVGAWTGDAVCWCTVESQPSRRGEIVVLRVAGEVDVATLPAVEWAFSRCIARRPRYLVVDLAPLEFCSARGMSLLFDTGVTAREQGFGYAISSVPPHLDRLWQKLWPDELPSLYPSAAAAVLAIRARLARTRSSVVDPSRPLWPWPQTS